MTAMPEKNDGSKPTRPLLDGVWYEKRIGKWHTLFHVWTPVRGDTMEWGVTESDMAAALDHLAALRGFVEEAAHGSNMRQHRLAYLGLLRFDAEDGRGYRFIWEEESNG